MAAIKSLYYVAAFTGVGYLLMKVVERDPDNLRKELTDNNQLDHHNEAKRRNAAFMQILRHTAEGKTQEEAVRLLQKDLEKTPK